MADVPARDHDFAFVMEQQVGLRTNYLNWRRIVDADDRISASWVPVTYYEDGGLIERMRFLPHAPRAVLRSHLQVARGLGRKRYDAILFCTFNPAVTHARLVRTQRTFLFFDVTPIQYERMAVWYNHPIDKSPWLAAFKHRRVCDVFRAADGLFACSNWSARSAVEDYGVDPARIHILPFNVDTQLWRPGAREQMPRDGKTRILFVGGDLKRKGGDLLLRWAVETSRTDWEVHLVTSERLDPPHGVIVHNGLGSNSSALIELTQCSDLFVLPTRADCFSIASLEAMAVGLPVITCAVGGIPDIVREGETGYLIEPDDYPALCERLEYLLDNPGIRAEMGCRAREVARAEFDAARVVGRGLRLMAGE